MSPEKLNDLTRGKWLKYSISVWGNIKQSVQDRALKRRHPAVFPLEIPLRLIKVFTRKGDVVLDPFLGTGTTLLACKHLGRNGIGIDLSPEFVKIAKERLRQVAIVPSPTRQVVYCDDSRNLLKHVDGVDSIDFVVTSPPYWRIMKEKKTFLKRDATPYTELDKDIGNLEEYNEFLEALVEIFTNVHTVLKAKKFAVIDLMDVRIQDKFFPMHVDLIQKMKSAGFDLWDIIIWDRHLEYNRLSAMRYPYAFYVNKVHEYLLIFQKQEPE